MKVIVVILGLLAVGLVLGAGYVAWLVFGGGPEKWRADRALAKRTYTADTPIAIGEFVITNVPRGFKLADRKDSLAEHRDRDTVSFELTLGQYVALGGGRTPAQMYISVAPAGKESAILPTHPAWTSQGSRAGLLLFDGKRPDMPEQVVVAAVDPQHGRRAELRTTSDIYTTDQGFAIVCGVVRSMTVHQPAIDSVFATARANLATDQENQTRAFKVIAAKLGPVPDEPGVPRRLPDGGFVMRDYKEDTGVHTAMILGSQPVDGDPEKAVSALTLDGRRITPDLDNAVASTDSGIPLPEGVTRPGVLALWLDVDGALRIAEIQTGGEPHWIRLPGNDPWRAALKDCAQRGRLTFIRFAEFWDFNHHKAEDIGAWIDGSKRLAEWARQGHPLWIPKP